jgi:predicted esterase
MVRMPLLLFIVISAFMAWADVINLKNGEKYEGILLREDDTTITLKISIGEMSFDKNEIAKIERSGSKNNSTLSKQWEKNKDNQPRIQKKNSSLLSGIKQGVLTIGIIEFDKSIYSHSNIPPEKSDLIPTSSRAGVYYPKKYVKNKKWPVFFAMEPGEGNGISAIAGYTCFADSLGFLVAAPGIDNPGQDNEISRYYYILHIIALLDNNRIINTSQVYIGGFSGGAKWALHIGAFGGDIFSGILAAGCNEDFATIGYNELKNTSCLNIPHYFLNGDKDEIAGTGISFYQKMVKSIKRTGFKTVTFKEYEGGHSLPVEDTFKAFEWLLRQ